MNTLMKCAATALTVMSLNAFAQVPAGYPADYKSIDELHTESADAALAAFSLMKRL